MKYFVTYFKSHLFLNDKKSKLHVHNNLTYTNLHKSECKVLIVEADTWNQNVQEGLKRTNSAF